MKRAATTTPLPYEGTKHQTLSAYIQARFDEFSRSQKDVAQYIVDHLDEAAFQTAEELARRANTSSSTVVRFSQALGFEGFPELQGAAREEYRRMHATPPAQGTASAAPLFSLDQSEFETALAADHVNVEETARKVSRTDVEAAIDATLSEVAKLAQIRLYYSSNSPAYVRSHTALLSMVQALAYGVYSRDATQYAERIKAFRLK